LRFDATAPTATVDPLPAITTTPSFVVHWRGADNASGLVSFDVQYRDSLVSYWSPLALETTADSVVVPTEDFVPENHHTYYFRARARDVAGNVASYPVSSQAQTHFVEGAVDVPAQPAIPGILALHQNTPNPFDRTTTIRLELPSTVSAELAVYDIHGRLVRTLHKGITSAGITSIVWDGRDDSGARVSSGIYVCKLEAAGLRRLRRLAVIH
ncbi:MAG TPA: FlgD immunoglobulin-like domain containing protein, partial [Candidatus Eisenbacteria bacterium]|nr:FlgD immunoglobulin-like domain containing protein [Candidatus Eisenbacteria bacterium]